MFMQRLPPKERVRMIGESKRILNRHCRLKLRGWPMEMTIHQMRSWMDSQGVHALKVKKMSDGFEVDPKSGRDSQLLHTFTGKYFQNMNQPIVVYEMETPKELTTEEVYEVALEWLRE